MQQSKLGALLHASNLILVYRTTSFTLSVHTARLLDCKFKYNRTSPYHELYVQYLKGQELQASVLLQENQETEPTTSGKNLLLLTVCHFPILFFFFSLYFSVKTQGCAQLVSSKDSPEPCYRVRNSIYCLEPCYRLQNSIYCLEPC
jgi:hypothetical protein